MEKFAFENLDMKSAGFTGLSRLMQKIAEVDST